MNDVNLIEPRGLQRQVQRFLAFWARESQVLRATAGAGEPAW
jgi:hypothetical protein